MQPVLQLQDLEVELRTQQGILRPLRGVSFDLQANEVLGLVGESGSGKSMTAAAIMGVLPHRAKVHGSVRFEGKDLLTMSRRRLRKLTGRDLAMVLQDPMTALNPLMRIGDQIGEPLREHRNLGRSETRERSAKLLDRLQVPDARSRLRAYPHNFSGGMRQRVASAIAISCSPKVLIADEPTTALDVTVAAAYIKLLKQIQAENAMSVVFISHDIGLVSRFCDRVAVMYGGRVVEIGDTASVMNNPGHPYTKALLDCVPDVTRDTSILHPIEGQPPTLTQVPGGCPFHPRCQYAEDLCRTDYPHEEFARSRVACWWPLHD